MTPRDTNDNNGGDGKHDHETPTTSSQKNIAGFYERAQSRQAQASRAARGAGGRDDSRSKPAGMGAQRQEGVQDPAWRDDVRDNWLNPGRWASDPPRLHQGGHRGRGMEQYGPGYDEHAYGADPRRYTPDASHREHGYGRGEERSHMPDQGRYGTAGYGHGPGRQEHWEHSDERHVRERGRDHGGYARDHGRDDDRYARGYGRAFERDDDRYGPPERRDFGDEDRGSSYERVDGDRPHDEIRERGRGRAWGGEPRESAHEHPRMSGGYGPERDVRRPGQYPSGTGDEGRREDPEHARGYDRDRWTGSEEQFLRDRLIWRR